MRPVPDKKKTLDAAQHKKKRQDASLCLIAYSLMRERAKFATRKLRGKNFTPRLERRRSQASSGGLVWFYDRWGQERGTKAPRQLIRK